MIRTGGDVWIMRWEMAAVERNTEIIFISSGNRMQ